MLNGWGWERKTFVFRIRGSICCFYKKLLIPVGRRWLIAIINMVEIETIF